MGKVLDNRQKRYAYIQFYHLIAIWPWASHLTFQCHIFSLMKWKKKKKNLSHLLLQIGGKTERNNVKGNESAFEICLVFTSIWYLKPGHKIHSVRYSEVFFFFKYLFYTIIKWNITHCRKVKCYLCSLILLRQERRGMNSDMNYCKM